MNVRHAIALLGLFAWLTGVGNAGAAEIAAVAPTPTCSVAASTLAPIVGNPLVLTASCTAQPIQYVWSNCASKTSTCIATASVPGTVTYSVAAVNTAGTGAAASVSVIWAAEASLNAGSLPCNSPIQISTACTSGQSGAITLQAIYSCQGGVAQITSWQVVQDTCSTAPATSARYVAWEFYNRHTDDYFITADLAERAALDNGFGDSPWTETGVTYRVWALGELGTSDMCRFYGDPRVDPVSGKRTGPDSHFFTAAPDECAAVSSRWPAWLLEGHVFAVALPSSSGQCPPQSIAVTRLFNPSGTPRHRYVVTTDAKLQMMARGWQSEGVVWCAGQ